MPRHGSVASARPRGDGANPRRGSASEARRHRELVARAQRDPGERTGAELVEAFRPLVSRLARRYHRGEEPLEDLEQVAWMGLWKAVGRYDPAQGSAFVAFAVPTITGELRRHFRDRGWSVNVPRRLKELSLALTKGQEALTARLGRPPTLAELATHLGAGAEEILEARELGSAMRPTSLDKPVTTDEPDGGALVDMLGGPDDGYDRVDAAVLGDSLLSGLEDRERSIVHLRFRDELTQAQIGERLGISQMHVSRLLRRTLAELEQLARVG